MAARAAVATRTAPRAPIALAAMAARGPSACARTVFFAVAADSRTARSVTETFQHLQHQRPNGTAGLEARVPVSMVEAAGFAARASAADTRTAVCATQTAGPRLASVWTMDSVMSRAYVQMAARVAAATRTAPLALTALAAMAAPEPSACARTVFFVVAADSRTAPSVIETSRHLQHQRPNATCRPHGLEDMRFLR